MEKSMLFMVIETFRNQEAKSLDRCVPDHVAL
jgi:hypothetical protein